MEKERRAHSLVTSSAADTPTLPHPVLRLSFALSLYHLSGNVAKREQTTKWQSNLEKFTIIMSEATAAPTPPGSYKRQGTATHTHFIHTWFISITSRTSRRVAETWVGFILLSILRQLKPLIACVYVYVLNHSNERVSTLTLVVVSCECSDFEPKHLTKVFEAESCEHWERVCYSGHWLQWATVLWICHNCYKAVTVIIRPRLVVFCQSELYPTCLNPFIAFFASRAQLISLAWSP